MNETIKDKDADKAKGQEADLDSGLDETFPASDAPAATQPGSGHGDKDKPAAKREQG
jgi:hypothetical protein